MVVKLFFFFGPFLVRSNVVVYTLYSIMCTWNRCRRALIPQTQKFHESNTHKRFKHTVKNAFNTFIVGICRDAHHRIAFSDPLLAILRFSRSFFAPPVSLVSSVRCIICYSSYRSMVFRVAMHPQQAAATEHSISSGNGYGSNGDGCNTISNSNINIIQSMEM